MAFMGDMMSPTPLWQNGPAPGAFYNFPANPSNYNNHTTQDFTAHIDEECIGDGLLLKPRSLHSWLTRVLYNKRSKMDPLWSNYIVAGIQVKWSMGITRFFSRALVRKCMEVMYYRDARAFQRYQIGVVTAEGINIEDAEIKHNWSLAHMIQMK
ncbi:Proteasome subunit beta type [Operophtera brumata]|uniref:Proteasome subunit beta type n=1 Tax=Operophtera brumata TaxID=104452 RepID=A0A0L7LHP1_OPEBR|nr:Proteasome subunit beta type [Operophtera brumata]